MGAAGFRSTLLAMTLAGCTSIAADARTLESTRWHVATINSRATSTTADYGIEFKNGRIGGRFGCNGFGGRYSIQRDQLIARDVASTLMGCPEPAASFESQGFAILNQPMRMIWSSGRNLTLSNSAGSMMLERTP